MVLTLFAQLGEHTLLALLLLLSAQAPLVRRNCGQAVQRQGGRTQGIRRHKAPQKAARSSDPPNSPSVLQCLSFAMPALQHANMCPRNHAYQLVCPAAVMCCIVLAWTPDALPKRAPALHPSAEHQQYHE